MTQAVADHAGRPASVVVCVDDYGLHTGVNEAVLRLVALGRISAVSCMVGAPEWSRGAGVLRAIAPSMLDAGLHFDLTEFPLQKSLRRPLGRWIAQSQLRLVDRAAMKVEIEAQLDRFETGLGRMPAHVDGHQHVHQFPVIRDLLLDVLSARYGSNKPWLRSTRAAIPGGKAAIIEALGARGLESLARRGGYLQNLRMLGVYDFSGGAARFSALLEEWLGAAREGDMLVCHPATSAPGADPIGTARIDEFGVLAGDEFARQLAANGLRVTRLAAASPAA